MLTLPVSNLRKIFPRFAIELERNSVTFAGELGSEKLSTEKLSLSR